MIFTIPLNKVIEDITVRSSNFSTPINAMHISSNQSLHFMGTLPEDLYPFVYGGKSRTLRLWHGDLLDNNTIETKGKTNDVDAIIYELADIRFLLVPKFLLEKFLKEQHHIDDISQYYKYNSYSFNDEDLKIFLNLHTAVLNNEEVLESEIKDCLLRLLKKPLQKSAVVDKRYVLVKRAIEMMKQYIKEPIQIKELTKKLNTSERTLELVFQKFLTISPKAYYKRLLLSYVEIALRKEGEQNVSEVLQEFQIYNLSQFGASFKKNFDSTPSDILSMKNKNNPFGWDENVFFEFS